MCGIFGVMARDSSALDSRALASTVRHLFKLSESRGKEAAGLAILSGNDISIYKDAVPSTVLIRRRDYREMIRRALGGGREQGPVAIIGHSRLVTDGSREDHQNNQPVIVDGAVGIHNGIVANCEDLWRTFPSLERRYKVDTEVILALLRARCHGGEGLAGAAAETFRLIRGAASIAVLFDDRDELLLATNNGSLYLVTSRDKDVFIFASEKYILTKLTGRRSIRGALGEFKITHLEPGRGVLVNINDLSVRTFPLGGAADGGEPPAPGPRRSRREIVDIVSPRRQDSDLRKKEPFDVNVWLQRITPLFPHDEDAVDALQRCTKCILPETMPFINFDDDGVCNYCRNYVPLREKGPAALEELADRYRRSDGRPDCLVGLSGGRDSTYGLHYIKTVLGMNPVAFTYDWGMITDLARRNVSRICGKLGVEHILVSADIPKKRRYIRKNVTAWLKRPELGMIPLFMAGDKQYFYYANQLEDHLGVDLLFLCENMLERTDFKWGYGGISPTYIDEDHVYTQTLGKKLKLAGYYGLQYIHNPSYINMSLVDTVFAYACYYLIRRDYRNLYRYIRWDEETIIGTLVDEYDWELATDTDSTWRIGDGTASFYNYIYYMIGGFSEIETFRSNQVREGIITRDEALTMARRENKPRFESIKWYCDTIGIDCEEALGIINTAPKLYPVGRS